MNNKGIKLFITINNKEYEVKKLLNVGQKITKDISIEGNIALFKTSIKNILFQKSGKYDKYPKNYNIAIIDELCTNKNLEETGNILFLEYLDCLKYYCKDQNALKNNYLNIFNCLKGLELLFDKLPKN